MTAVSSNTALYGGGVAIETKSGCSRFADLRMYSSAAGTTKIYGNSASISGGGVYIFRGGGPANVFVSNASIQNNTAPVAAALYLGNAGSANFNTTSVGFGDDLADCAVGVPCGSISGNISSNGQVVYGADNNKLEMNYVEVTGNQGTELIRLNDLRISNTLIADNMSTSRLLETQFGTISFSTITGNQVGGSEVIGVKTGGTFSMYNSVTWQPGKTILHDDGALPNVSYVVTNELASFSGPNALRNLVANPRFIDPTAGGDYRPTAGSPVVDYAADFSGGVLRDLLHLPREIDLDVVADAYGNRDVGAYERQAVQPLVENGEFPSNVRVWTITNGAVASYDYSQNAPGSVGGSMHVKESTTADNVLGAVQCIHLPAPGTYTLNGYGKVATGGNTALDQHRAVLYWQLRLAGSETCGGTLTAEGGKLLAVTGNTWRRPPLGSQIQVTPQEWTSDTSVLVYLYIESGTQIGGMNRPSSPTLKEGWFDNVTLDLEEPVTDRIFFDGFDQIPVAPAE